MPVIRERKFSGFKYYPVSKKTSGNAVASKTASKQKLISSLPASLKKMNDLAKEFPFCIMYRAKDHDPL